jgi:hypothetical protein
VAASLAGKTGFRPHSEEPQKGEVTGSILKERPYKKEGEGRSSQTPTVTLSAQKVKLQSPIKHLIDKPNGRAN